MPEKRKKKPVWYLYLLECRDGTIYTGVTVDPSRRLKQHNDGKGARYTRGRRPVRMVYREKCKSESAAKRREYEIKKLPRHHKILLAGLAKKGR